MMTAKDQMCIEQMVFNDEDDDDFQEFMNFKNKTKKNDITKLF